MRGCSMKSRPKRIRPPRNRGEKWYLAARSGLTCGLCGEGSRPDDPLEVDHRAAWVRSGDDSLANKQLAHRSCNQWKGTT